MTQQKLTVPTDHVVSMTCLQYAIRHAMDLANFTVTVPAGCVASLDVQIHWAGNTEEVGTRDALYWTAWEILPMRCNVVSMQAFRHFNMPKDQIVVTVTVVEG